jgi:hypothetical protein
MPLHKTGYVCRTCSGYSPPSATFSWGRTVPFALLYVSFVLSARDQTDEQADGHEHQQHQVNE